MIRPSFEDLIAKVASNHSEFIDFYASIDLNDEKANQLGNALICGGVGNTFLKDLHIRIGHHMTEVGAQALCAGIQKSKLAVLRLRGGRELSMDMAGAEDMELMFSVEDGGEAGTGKQIDFILNQRVRYQQRAGERSVRNDPNFIKTMQAIYLHGVLGCETIQALAIHEAVGDMHHLVNAITKLCRLKISSVELSLPEIQILSNGLQQACKLEDFCLSGCGIGVEHMQVLSAVIGNHPSIEIANLKGNQICDAGVATFVVNWHHNSPIRLLSMEDNNIGRSGAQVLGRALFTHLSLCSLLVGENFDIGYEGIKLIADELPGSEISVLGLDMVVDWVEYEDVTCEAAVTQAFKRDVASKALLEGVRSSMYLEEVIDKGLNISPNEAAEIKLYLEANERGRFLLLEQHTLPPPIWCHFLANECQDQNLMFLFLRELPMLMANTNK